MKLVHLNFDNESVVYPMWYNNWSVTMMLCFIHSLDIGQKKKKHHSRDLLPQTSPNQFIQRTSQTLLPSFPVYELHLD